MKKRKNLDFNDYLAEVYSKQGEDISEFFYYLSEVLPIGRQLCALRRIKELTQVQLAKKLKMTQERIAFLERKKADPKFNTIQKMAKAMGMRLVLVENKKGGNEQ